ncbi:MAG: AI-2E family transporter [Tissierellia bacterium]|nr:AI-2E family transporter [Tissierellia bacterium]
MNGLEFIKVLVDRFLKTLKTRFLLFLLSFVLLGIGLMIFKIPYPWLIALGISLLDFLPVLGAGMVMIPWTGYYYFQGNSPMAIKIFVLYLLIFFGPPLLEPIFLGKTIGVSPWVTFIISTLSLIFFGFWGIFIGPFLSVLGGLLWEWKKYYKREV